MSDEATLEPDGHFTDCPLKLSETERTLDGIGALMGHAPRDCKCAHALHGPGECPLMAYSSTPCVTVASRSSTVHCRHLGGGYEPPTPLSAASTNSTLRASAVAKSGNGPHARMGVPHSSQPTVTTTKAMGPR